VIVVDARGHRCPVPSLKLRRALSEAEPGVEVILVTTDPMARIDIPFLMSELAGQVISVAEDAGTLTFTVMTGDGRKD
jgi:tRNA 2-thiouridine synthesizing protein A